MASNLNDDSEGNIARAKEKLAEFKLILNFFKTGRLLKLSDVQPCKDDEYICKIFEHSVILY